jgi:serine/threonine protein kinase
MNVAIQCTQCQRPMEWTGVRGLCARCLLSCTTERLAEPESRESEVNAAAVEVWECGLAVGPQDRFLLLDKLGEGGMGEVWLANDQALGQPGQPEFVALKFLSSTIQRNAKALASLRTEVLRSQKLTHANIVRVFDLHTTTRGTPFIKMEFVEGNSLRRWMKQRADQVMPWRMAATIGHQLVSALHYAHRAEGIIHRDLKPGNVLLSAGVVSKLTDFGIAGAMYGAGRATGPELALGTIGYASPQQLAGLPPRPEDDLYSLGVTLYELLTGTLPLEADYAQEFIEKVQYEPPQPVSERLRACGRREDVPWKLVLLVQQCLEKDPLRRPNPQELVAQIPQLLVGSAPASTASRATQPEWTEEPAPPPPKEPWPAWAFCLVIAAIAAAAWITDLGGTRKACIAAMAQLEQYLKIRSGSKGEGPKLSPNSPPLYTNRSRAQESLAAAAVPERAKTGAASVPLSEPSVTAPPSIEPVPAPEGTVRIKLSRNDMSSRQNFLVLIEETNGAVVRTRPFTNLNSGAIQLPAGTYHARLEKEGSPPWRIESKPFEVIANQGTYVTLSFGYGDLTLTSDPPGAQVTWPPEAVWQRIDPTNGVAPVTAHLRSGALRLTAAYRGYFDTIATNYFYPAEDEKSHGNALIRLNPRPVPQPQGDFTNSLGMVFRYVVHLGHSDFWASAMETRVSDFRQFVQDRKYKDASVGMYSTTKTGFVQRESSWENPGFEQKDDYPVIGVNWKDATEFCKWLTMREQAADLLLKDQEYSLPGTNQWFAMAENQEFPSGSYPDGNYCGTEVLNSDWPAKWDVWKSHHDDFPRTAPVGTFKPNKLGLYDLGGNAAEWCREKVTCGGSWADGGSDTNDLRTTHLDAPLDRLAPDPKPSDPLQRNDRNGFRVIIIENRSPTRSPAIQSPAKQPRKKQ